MATKVRSTRACFEQKAVSAEARIAKELAGLPALDRDQLKRRWRRLYRTELPNKVSRMLLQYAVAYAFQEEALGGLKPSVARAVDGALNGKPIVSATLRPGTKLLREWNGVIHEVKILDEGVLYRGERHRSLSGVAKMITGTHRSGLLFFGLKPPAGVRSSAGRGQAEGTADRVANFENYTPASEDHLICSEELVS
jgi:hypothetical protein